MKTKRIASGLYRVITEAGRHYIVEEVGRSEGFSKAVWHIRTIAANSLAEAKTLIAGF